MDPSKATELFHIAEVVQNFWKTEGSLATTQYKQFWSQLTTPETVTGYLTVLLVKLIAMETGEDKQGTLIDLVQKLKFNGDFGTLAISDKDSKMDDETYSIFLILGLL
jgi:hypothetical protein